jgi:hypothetical protein
MQRTAIELSRRRILGICPLSLTPFRLVMADHATSSGACHSVMTCIVARDATHYGALDATLGMNVIGARH